MQWNTDDETYGGFSIFQSPNKPWLPVNNNFKQLNVQVSKVFISSIKIIFYFIFQVST